jgi:hypothetical protein
LILPNTRCLSYENQVIISDFVEKGGGLVSTFESGLFDKNGQQTLDSKLNSCLGITFINDGSYWKGFDVYMRFEDEMTLPVEDLEGHLAPNGGVQKMVELTGARAEARVLGGSSVHYGPLGKTMGSPSLTTFEKGKGRSAYFAFPIGNAFKEFGMSDHEELILAAVRWTAKEIPPVIAVNCPKTVAVTAFEQSGGRLVIHLVKSARNEVLWSFDEISMGAIFSICIQTAMNPKRVYGLPDQADLDWSKKDGTVIVNVPPVKDHFVVIIQP